jgi:futalosine hydrolase
MEGFGVALACRLAGVPLTIIRGISNTAGDRDHARWRVPEALAAAAGLTLRILRTIEREQGENDVSNGPLEEPR